MISIKNVSKEYPTSSGSFKALKNVSFELPSKGLVSLTGENGCGKSTILNLISTFDQDFKGEILIDDLNVRTDTDFIRKMLCHILLKALYY